MAIQLSIIIPVDNAPLSELTVPLASLNNQLGVNPNQIEVLLVDNGEFHLDDGGGALNLFAHLRVRLITTAQVCGRMGAVAAGVGAAKGETVMLLDANTQLYHPFTLQMLLGLQSQHPDADVIGGSILVQGLTRQRRPVYRAGQSRVTLHGLMIRRAVMSSDAIALDDRHGEFSEELAARLMWEAVGGVATTDEITCVRFSSRTHAMTGTQPVINGGWLTMMADYLTILDRQNPARFDTAYAKFVVRLYAQIGQVPVAALPPLTAQVAEIVRAHAGAWQGVMRFVAAARRQDQTVEAPWNAEADKFDHYLAQLSHVAANQATTGR